MTTLGIAGPRANNDTSDQRRVDGYPRGVQHPALLFFIPVFVLLFFSGLWCGISLLLSRAGGWARLAERFPGPEQPEGKHFRWQSGRLGLVNYNRCLTIYVSKAGSIFR
jgi:hypothetical protein